MLRDDFGADSDVDVLVEFQPGHVPGLSFVSMEHELSGLLHGRRVDLVTPRFLNERIREQVLREAEPLYVAASRRARSSPRRLAGTPYDQHAIRAYAKRLSRGRFENKISIERDLARAGTNQLTPSGLATCTCSDRLLIALNATTFDPELSYLRRCLL